MFKQIKYQYTDRLKEIKQYLSDIESNYSIIALDFETTGLGHPLVTKLTHLSLAISDEEAYVFIIRNKLIQTFLLDWIVTTNLTQLWHNLTFDGKFILFYTNKLPKNYIDTQLLAKTLLNHVDKYKAKTGLKDLCSSVYGSWSIDSNNFTIDNMYNEKLLKYTAIDVCATYYLYKEMSKYIGG